LNIINYKLLNFLNLLSKEDLTEFKKFICSPIYSLGRNYLPMLEELIKYKNADADKISATDLYNAVYPGKKYSGQTLKNRFSELLKLGEEYIIYKGVKNDIVERDSILTKAYLENRMFKFYESKFKKALSYLELQKTDDKKFADIYSLNLRNLWYLNETEKFDKYFTNIYDHSIYSVSMSLISLFDYGIEFLQQVNLNRKYDHNIVLNIVRKIKYEDIFDKKGINESEILNVVKLYYYLFNAFDNLEQESFYFEARKVFNKISASFSDSYKYKFYMIFIYYCTRMQNLGRKEYHAELFKLYNEKLDNGLITDFTENIFPVNNFRDYVFIGIEMGKPDWVINFIKKYSGYLPKKNRENETNLSYSRVSSYLGDYRKALEYVLKVKPYNYMHYLDASVAKLISYYELDMEEEAFLEIDKLIHYVKSHREISKIHKIYNKNFIKIYSKLLKIKFNPSKKEIVNLEGEFKELKFVTKRDWIREKIKLLKK